MRLLLSSLLVGLVATGFAQDRSAAQANGTLAGVVVNAAGAPVAAATVDLLTAAAIVRTTFSDTAGMFRFDNVPVGTYRLQTFRAGVGHVLTNVTVVAGSNMPVRVTLGIVSRDERGSQGHDNVMMDGIRALARPADATIVAAAPVEPGRSGERSFAVGAAHPASAAYAAPPPMPGRQDWNTEAYARIDEHGFRRAVDDPLSTFSIDVDTASYANVRRFLNDGALPPADAVRIEELLNYFRFDYPAPARDRPFSVTTDVGPAPWNAAHRLVLVGLKARPIDSERTPPRNLVFLLDVSGSMAASDKLPLVKTAMRMLTSTLTPADRVAIVVYAGASGVVLPSTSGAHRHRIDQAIAELRPGGGTNGAAGIQLAYDIASRTFIDGGINRVILATDGDFNLGITSQGELLRLIEQKRERGVFLSVLGVGTGNLKDSTMEQLADRGNGNYSYLDSLHEAQRVLIAEAGSTLVTVAKDVKIQVEFNPARVGAYRLIGYENRALANRDFNDDRKDAGEIGAGHTVTALYEIVPPGADVATPEVDPLRYQSTPRVTRTNDAGELMTVKLRYKQPDGDTSQLVDVPVRDRPGALSDNLGFAAAIAEFGMLLRGSEHVGASSWNSARELARRHRGADADGYRAELARLIELAGALQAQRDAVTRVEIDHAAGR